MHRLEKRDIRNISNVEQLANFNFVFVIRVIYRRFIFILFIAPVIFRVSQNGEKGINKKSVK